MELLKRIDRAVVMTDDGQYLEALTEFLDIYGTTDAPPLNSAKAAIVQKKYRAASDLCKRAIDLEFYNGDHYANYARVYLLIGNRKKALETVEGGLKIAPENENLAKVRRELGVRSRPAVPFLDRSHPINVSLGQVRHAKKAAEPGEKRTRKR